MVTPVRKSKKTTNYSRPNYSRMPTYYPKANSSLVYQQDIKGVEKKDITVIANSVIMNTAATFTVAPVLLNAAGQSADSSGRIGRRIFMKSILFRYVFNVPEGQTVTSNSSIASFRILIIYDKQTNKALPSVTDVLSSTDVHAAINLANSDRFVVLFDKYVNMAAGNLDCLYRKINMESIYSGSGAIIGDMTSGSVFYMIAPGFAYAAPGPTLSFTSRIRFTDV